MRDELGSFPEASLSVAPAGVVEQSVEPAPGASLARALPVHEAHLQRETTLSHSRDLPRTSHSLSLELLSRVSNQFGVAQRQVERLEGSEARERKRSGSSLGHLKTSRFILNFLGTDFETVK